MKTEADVRVMQLQAEECQRLPATSRSWERQGKILPRVSEGAQPCRHLDFGLLAFRTDFCCFKPPSLWYFITAALENEYTWEG